MSLILLLRDTNPEMEPESHKVVGLEQRVKYVLLWYLERIRHSDAASRIRHLGFEFHHSVFVLAGIDPSASFEHGQGLPFFLGNAQVYTSERIFRQHLIDSIQQGAKTDTPCG